MGVVDAILIQPFITLNEEEKIQAVHLFVDGFAHMFTFSKEKETLITLFRQGVREEYVYVAKMEESIVGFIGLGTNHSRVFHFEKEVCRDLFGRIKGTIVFKQLKAILETPAVKGEKDVYIDFLTTHQEYRGRGVATELLNYACSLVEYDTCYIEVLSKNVTAWRLYKQLGFEEYKKVHNLAVMIQGWGYLVELKKPCDLKEKEGIPIDIR